MIGIGVAIKTSGKKIARFIQRRIASFFWQTKDDKFNLLDKNWDEL